MDRILILHWLTYHLQIWMLFFTLITFLSLLLIESHSPTKIFKKDLAPTFLSFYACGVYTLSSSAWNEILDPKWPHPVFKFLFIFVFIMAWYWYQLECKMYLAYTRLIYFFNDILWYTIEEKTWYHE